MFSNISFVNPIFFALLLLLPAIGLWYFYKRHKRYANIRLSTLESIEGIESLRGRLRIILPIFRALAFIALVIALARPQRVLQEEEVKAEGIDIMLVMDLSSSMLAQDFQPNRMEASKQVAIDFVNKRPYDRVGLVAFSGEAFTQCPLTTDHRVVNEFIGNLQSGLLEDGTAIGMGLATAVNRIKDSEAKSKIIILLTDGDNNAGYVKPITAAEIAKEFGVKVYSIGAGSRGNAIAPVSRRSNGEYIFGLTRVQIDEALMTKISEMTGGKYFRADSAVKLEQIYELIDQLEKTEVEVTTLRRYSEAFHFFAFIAILFLCLEIILRYTIFRTIP